MPLRLLVVLSLVTIVSCSRGDDARSGGPPASGPPNVLLVVCDTLRADRLGCYGNDRRTSPFLDALASRSTRYTRAFASAPWTLPTHASLFTGMHPFEHGVHTYEPNHTRENLRPLADAHLTLAEVLAERGWSTGGIISNMGWFDPVFQLDQGFDDWQLARSYASRLNLRVARWLDEVGDDPFFLFVNYTDTHYVYNTRPVDDLDVVPDRDEGELLHALTEAVLAGEGPVPAELRQRVLDQYDTAVANLDDGLEGLVGLLRERGLLDDTLLVITSDHGEFFGEHRLVEHSKDVYDEVLRVPLVVKAPGQRTGRVDDRPTSSADVAGLVLSLLPDALVGDARPLFPNLPGEAPVVSENYWARLKDLQADWGHRFDRTRHVLVEWPWKFIASSDGAHELYDLAADPAESEDRVDDEPERAAAMAARLRELMDAPRGPGGAAPPVDLDRDLERTLRALGYLGDPDGR